MTVSGVGTAGGTLTAEVEVASQVGHKFPSGVGFRRAFVELDVLDDAGRLLWASGRTDRAGVLVDETGTPIAGELWWKGDCSGLLHPDELVYQPHYQVVRRQDQAQIYQELVTAPPGPDAECGRDATPLPPFTTSFLSICGHVKDNRILPDGFLPLPQRVAISRALGAGEEMAQDSGADGVGDDPDYVTGGRDRVRYEVPLAELPRRPQRCAPPSTTRPRRPTSSRTASAPRRATTPPPPLPHRPPQPRGHPGAGLEARGGVERGGAGGGRDQLRKSAVPATRSRGNRSGRGVRSLRELDAALRQSGVEDGLDVGAADGLRPGDGEEDAEARRQGDGGGEDAGGERQGTSVWRPRSSRPRLTTRPVAIEAVAAAAGTRRQLRPTASAGARAAPKVPKAKVPRRAIRSP